MAKKRDRKKMKIGDLIEFKLLTRNKNQCYPGTVVEFLPASHPKQWQKVRVLTPVGLQDWIMEYCKVINSGS